MLAFVVDGPILDINYIQTHHFCCLIDSNVHFRVLYRIFLPGGELDSMYVFLTMYSLLCLPCLLSFIWQWFSKCKKFKLYSYICFSVHVVIKFQGGEICQGNPAL